MMSISTVLIVLGILSLSTLTRSSLGFGDALIGMPLLTLAIGIQNATPLVALVSLTIALVILSQDWRNVDLRVAWRLILTSFLGIPVGLLLLTTIPEAIVTLILGIILVAYGIYSLFSPRFLTLHNEKMAYVFGFIAGILGGAYNTNGPPIVIYGTLRGWQPDMFRATLQSYFFPTLLFITIGHGISGLWTSDILTLFLFSLPIIFLSAFIGKRINKWISSPIFSRAVFIFLIVIGLFMIITT
jgi:uncharacterized protein